MISITDLRARSFNFKASIFSSILCRQCIAFSQLLQELLSLDAHNKVGATFQIQTEMNVRRQSRFDARPGKVFDRGTVSWAYHDVQSHDSNNGNNDYALQEILFLHYSNSNCGLTSFWLFVDAGDRGAGDFEDCFICAAN